MIIVEAAVETVEAALMAERAGVDRIELCADLDSGGTTPSAEMIAAVAAQAQVPVFVLIRPRMGGFVYTDPERETMIRDIELARTAGVAGIVTGALNSRGQADVEHTRRLVNAAAGLPVTFHRAFDLAVNRAEVLEQVIDAGASRLLTSGGAPMALEGADEIAALVGQAGERITIMAGGSIREHNVLEVIALSGVREVHTRLVDESRMRSLVDAVRSNYAGVGSTAERRTRRHGKK